MMSMLRYDASFLMTAELSEYKPLNAVRNVASHFLPIRTHAWVSDPWRGFQGIVIAQSDLIVRACLATVQSRCPVLGEVQSVFGVLG